MFPFRDILFSSLQVVRRFAFPQLVLHGICPSSALLPLGRRPPCMIPWPIAQSNAARSAGLPTRYDLLEALPSQFQFRSPLSGFVVLLTANSLTFDGST
jgi:hypothetical protein